MLFDIVNLPYWIFLVMGVLLFLVITISGGDDDLELDIDRQVDLEFSHNPRGRYAVTTAERKFRVGQVGRWLGIGKTPLILLLATDFSLLGLVGWMFNVALFSMGSYLEGWLSGVVLALSLSVSLLSGGLMAQPIGKIFAGFGEDAKSNRIIGCQGTVRSQIIPRESQGELGQVNILSSRCHWITIDATLPNWAKVLPNQGDLVLVIGRQLKNYIVIVKDSSDEQQWLAKSPPIPE